MRIECMFEPTVIPISYHYMFASLIKRAISSSSKEKFDEIYFHDGKKTKQSKSFCFSVYMKEFELTADCFQVNGELKCIISTPDAELMIHIYNGLLTSKTFKYKAETLSLLRVNLLKEKLPTSSEAIFKTLSPIAMRDESGRFIGPDAISYHDSLNYISNEIVTHVRGDGLKTPLTFTPTQMKKQVVKLKHEEFAALNEQQTLYVNAYRGTFKLQGDPADLALLAQTGIGFRRGQGFGNVKLIEG